MIDPEKVLARAAEILQTTNPELRDPRITDPQLLAVVATFVEVINSLRNARKWPYHQSLEFEVEF